MRLARQKQQQTQKQNDSSRQSSSIQQETLQLETIQSDKPANQNSLTRIESKKELIEKQQKSQHLIPEDLIIHENINDSSCTPADLSMLQKSVTRQITGLETIQHEDPAV